MPIVSKAQWGFLFANKMPFAKKWAHATPGGKGARFRRLPETVKGYDAKAGGQIAGNLYRGNDGKFHAGEGGADAQAKATIAENKRLNAATPKGGKGKKGGKKKAGAKPKKVKVVKPKLTPEQRAAERAKKMQANRDAVKKAMMDSDQGLAPTGFDNLMKLAAGQPLDEPGKQAMVEMGLGRYRSDGTMALTTYGRQAVRASNTGDTQAAVAAIDSAPKQKPTYTGAPAPKPAPKPKAAPVPETAEMNAGQQAANKKLTKKSVKVAHRTQDYTPPVFEATTYKSVDGQRRWLFVSSTAYQDRDGETVTRKALRQAVELADATGERGNLRYWHLPSHLGTCDWQMVSPDGTLLYESGTFASDAIADWYDAHKEQYVLSIGFRHPLSEPLADKSFETIAIQERSLLPVQYTSNVFTGKVV